MDPHPFQAAILERRTEDLARLLAPRAQLHSPVLHRPITGGRDVIAPLLGELRSCFSEAAYTDSLEASATLGLVFRAKIAELDAEGLQLLRLDADGLIEDITVMLRPLRAAMALAEAMGPKMERLPDGTYRPRTEATA